MKGGIHLFTLIPYPWYRIITEFAFAFLEVSLLDEIALSLDNIVLCYKGDNMGSETTSKNKEIA